LLPQPGSNGAACSAADNTPVTVTPQPFPKQERGARRRPSGIVKRHR
jgi:hypothetical protein